MATWQFDLHLIPEASLRSHYGKVPAEVDLEALQSIDWWREVPALADLERRLSALLLEGRSWLASVRTWGDEDGDRVDVCFDGDFIGEIFVRFDLRAPSREFGAGIVELAADMKCCLVDESLRVLAPDLSALAQALRDSPAARFVEDPKGFLEELA